jgi:NTP pyrophosphatase (non-canonical NTP hydrolase)
MDEAPNGTDDELTLDEYQRLASATDLEPTSQDPMIPLMALAGEVGSLIAEYKKHMRPGGESYVGFDAAVPVELGDILWYVAALARRSNLSLGDIARSNLAKTQGRYIAPDGAVLSFDEGFPEHQRLPRRFIATFTTHIDQKDGIARCRLRIEDEELGALIDDNSRHQDAYRFHDVFHIAHAAVLGWSPVLRSLIKAKRRFSKEMDRVEDGARAIATEEAVTAMIFQLAEGWSYFEAERVDDSILHAAQNVTSRLEVGTRSAAEWEQAILTGYAAWRGLRDAGGGRVAADLDARTVEFIGPE